MTRVYQKLYRKAVGVTDEAKSVADAKDTPTYSHMFGCWETLFIIKRMMEQSGYREASAGDKANLIETLENAHWFNEGIEHPQGPKQFNGKTHQGFARQNISHVVNRRLKRVHQTEIADSLYDSDVDYTKMAL